MAKPVVSLDEKIEKINSMVREGKISLHQSRLMIQAVRVSGGKRVNRRKPSVSVDGACSQDQ